MSQHQHLTQLKGKEGVGVVSALSISIVSCEGTEEGKKMCISSIAPLILSVNLLRIWSIFTGAG